MTAEFKPATGAGRWFIYDRGTLLGLAAEQPDGTWHAARYNAGGGFAQHREPFESRDALAAWMVGESFMGGIERP